MRLHRSFIVAITLVCMGLTACASGPSTQLATAWQLPGYVPVGFKTVLVIAVTRDAGRRRQFEDAFTYQLMGRGINAVSSYTVIPQDGQVPNDVLEAAIKKTGAQGVITTRYLGSAQQTTVVAGTMYGPAYAGPAYYGGFYGYYGSAWGYDYVPTQVNVDTVVSLETDMFDASKLEMVWSGTTRTTNPTSLGQEMAGYAKVIIDSMAQRGLLAANNG